MRFRTSILVALVVLAAWAVPASATGGDVNPLPLYTESPGNQVMIDTVPLPESPASRLMIGTWPTPERVFFTPWFSFIF